jgi:hypothetical protein
MFDRDQTIMKGLLDRLLAARARRDRETRYSDSWRAADDELHAIERAIFRVPLDSADDRDRSRETAAFPGRAARDAREGRDANKRYREERAG